MTKTITTFFKQPLAGQRNSQGSTTAELALSLPIFIVVTIFSINTAALIFAADFCDRACKDCARSAGQMSTPDQAVNAMNAAAEAHPVDNFFFQQLSPELLVYQDYNFSTSAPTPTYGSTSEYTGENGVNNITPAKLLNELPAADSSNDDKSVQAKETGLNKSLKKEKEAVSLEKFEAIIADPNQTVTAGPYVIVRTSMTMRIPVCIDFFGSKLFAGNVEGNPQLFRLSSIYTFPITNTYTPI